MNQSVQQTSTTDASATHPSHQVTTIHRLRTLPRSSSPRRSTHSTAPTTRSGRPVQRHSSVNARTARYLCQGVDVPILVTSRKQTTSRRRSQRPPNTTWSANKPGWDHGSSVTSSRRSSIPPTTARSSISCSPTLASTPTQSGSRATRTRFYGLVEILRSSQILSVLSPDGRPSDVGSAPTH